MRHRHSSPRLQRRALPLAPPESTLPTAHTLPHISAHDAGGRPRLPARRTPACLGVSPVRLGDQIETSAAAGASLCPHARPSSFLACSGCFSAPPGRGLRALLVSTTVSLQSSDADILRGAVRGSFLP